MKMSDIGLQAAIRSLLPHFVVAGKLACRIQDDIKKNGKRNGDAKTGNRFTEVVTDADIAIETYFGTVLLTSFEDVAFYGEEYERDRVSPYFPKEAPYVVTLDPVDGTLYFKDGLPLFAVIMTVCVKGAIAASVVYLPREEKFYGAIESEGAWTTTAADVGAGKPLTPYRVPTDGKVILVGETFKDRRPAIEALGFETANPSNDYDGSMDWFKTSIRMLSGEVAGMAYGKAQLIDACAIGFIVAKAGGKDNGPVINPESQRAEPLVVATSPETYDRLNAALKA
jgi:fructose-1,6-bisphosphatase/inositol monophosphatase family enzyme